MVQFQKDTYTAMLWWVKKRISELPTLEELKQYKDHQNLFWFYRDGSEVKCWHFRDNCEFTIIIERESWAHTVFVEK